MVNEIEIKSVIINDVKIAREALESIGFKTTSEGYGAQAYWIRLEVPEKYRHILY